MSNNVQNAESILNGMGISPHAKIPDDIPSIEDMTGYKFHRIKGEKGISNEDVVVFYKTAVAGYKSLYKVIEGRDIELLQLADAYGDNNAKLRNALMQIDQIKARGVEILEQTVAGVDTDVAVENSELKKANRSYAEDIATLRNTIDVLEENDRSIRQWGEQAQLDFAQMEAELEETKTKLEKAEQPKGLEEELQKAKNEYNEEVRKIETEKKHWAEKNREKDQYISELEKERTELSAQIDDLTIAIDTRGEEAPGNDLKARIEELEAANISLESSLLEAEEKQREWETYSQKLLDYSEEIAAELNNKKLINESDSSNPWDSIEDGSGGIPLEALKRQFSGLR